MPRGLVRAVVLATAVSMVASGAVAAAVDGASTGTLDGRVLMSPITLTLEVTPASLAVGQVAAATVSLVNLGPVAISRIAVRLRNATGLAVRGRQPQWIRLLAVGGSGSLSWSLCGRAPGSYLVFAEATLGAIVVDSPARLVTVRPGPGRCPGAGGPKRG